MNLSAPTQPVFWIAVALAVIAALAQFGIMKLVPVDTGIIWLIAFVVLAVGNVMKNI